MRSKILILICLFTTLVSAQQKSVIKGILLGHDKKPMPLADVHLIKAPASQSFAGVQVNRDGAFRIETAETGLIVAEFTGVNHGALDIPLLIEKPATIDLTVSLATYAYFDDPAELKLMSDRTDFAFERAQPMQKQADGTFTIDVETTNPTLSYQVFGAERNSRSINGTQSDRYEFDGSGDYRSIVNVKGGKVRIVFDPKKTVRSTAEVEFKFGDPSSPIAKIAEIQQEMTKREILWSTAVTEYVKGGNDFKKFKYDWSASQAGILARLNKENDPLVRQMLLMDYVDTKAKNATSADPAIGARLFKEIPPDSKLWMMPTLPLLNAAGELSGDENAHRQYLDSFLDKNPEMELKTNLIMNQLVSSRLQGDEKSFRLYYDMALKHFGGTDFAKAVQARFTPASNILTGNQLPAFRVKALGDSTKIYTNDTFKGKTVLLDFWATWCGPCVEEMENLQKAYEKFKSKNFEILSLSLDRSPDDVVKFRHDKWKMPWLHTFVTGDEKLTTAFEVVGIPHPILVDGTGTIIAVEEELRGSNLDATLSKFLDSKK